MRIILVNVLWITIIAIHNLALLLKFFPLEWINHSLGYLL